jgi:O-antigen/teichoic acid export membrane protein
MGIVIRKSLITSFFSYLGVIIGYLNILYFFPKFLSPSQIGLYRLILDSTILLAPFAQSGVMQGVIKFFPLYQQKENQRDFSTFSLLFTFFSFLVFSLLFFLLKDWVINFLFSNNAAEIRVFYDLILFLIIAVSLIALFEGFERARLNIVLVNFLRDVYIRLLTAGSVFLYFYEVISFEGLIYSLLVIYGSAALILLLKLVKNQQLSLRGRLSAFKPKELKSIIKYNLFMVISAGSSLVVGKIDSLMVSALLGLAENGIYTTLFYVAIVIEVPKRAIGQIAVSLFSKAFAQKKLEDVKSLYAKTSLNQLILGLLLYIGIVSNLHNLFFFIPNGETFAIGRWVVVIIGASRVIDMAAGANGELIVMSRYFSFNVIAIASLALLTVLSNYLLIPLFGINGAAIASLISMLCFNFVKMVFIYRKYRMQPFSKETLLVLAIGIFSFAIGWFIPTLSNPYFDLAYRSLTVLLVYSALVVSTAVSKDINLFLKQSIEHLRRRF